MSWGQCPRPSLRLLQCGRVCTAEFHPIQGLHAVAWMLWTLESAHWPGQSNPGLRAQRARGLVSPIITTTTPSSSGHQSIPVRDHDIRAFLTCSVSTSTMAHACMCIFPAAQLLPAESAMFMKPEEVRGTTTDCDGPVAENTGRTLLKSHGAAEA